MTTTGDDPRVVNLDDYARDVPLRDEQAAEDLIAALMDEAGKRIPAGRCICPHCTAQAQGRGLTCGNYDCMVWTARTLPAECLSYLVEARATMPELDEGAEAEESGPLVVTWPGAVALLVVTAVLSGAAVALMLLAGGYIGITVLGV